MKNQFISIPVDSVETIVKCLPADNVGKFILIMLERAKKTGLLKFRDSDLLVFLAATINNCPVDLDEIPETNDQTSGDEEIGDGQLPPAVPEEGKTAQKPFIPSLFPEYA